MYAVIMAGGSGTRLWPLSRQKKPKQLQAFVSDQTLIEETYTRLLPRLKPEKIFISTTPEYVEEIKRILPDIPKSNFIVEPTARGSAPACGLATMIINKIDPAATIAFLPSDHMIKDNDRFLNVLDYSARMAEKYADHILTIGINPTKPDTGLGYIKIDSQIDKDRDLKAFSVEKFFEKPTLAKAEEYAASWDYLWNAGMYIWKSETFIGLLKKHMAGTYNHLSQIVDAWGGDNEQEILKEEYKKVEKTSVDYGISEKTDKILVIPGDFGWSDIGSWGTLLEYLTEAHGAKVITKGHHIGVDNENCLIMAGDKLIATIGLKDTIIVDSPDAILVCDRSKSAELKDLLEKLKVEGKHLYL